MADPLMDLRLTAETRVVATFIVLNADDSGEEITPEEIGAALNFPRSTVYACLGQLAACGYLTGGGWA